MKTESLRALFARWESEESPGCAVAVYRDGEIAWTRGFGMAHLEHGIAIRPHTVFHVASLSKMFTAYVVAVLARDGIVSLDDDLRTYIPELLTPRVTFRQIVHHTSGMRDQWDLLRLAGWRNADLKRDDDILRLASRQRALNFEPGTRFQYINTGYTLTGIALRRVTGKLLRELARERIFAPLGMPSTQFHDDASRVVPRRAQAYYRRADGTIAIDMPAYETVGPTNLLTTVEDFARWEHHLLTGDPDLVAQLTTSGTLTDGTAVHYGFGLILGNYRGVPIIEHAGGDGGYRAHYLRVPSERLAVAIFANVPDVKPGAAARDVIDRLLELPAAAGDRAMPAWAGRAAGIPSPDPADLAAKCGTYRDALSGMTCRIESRGGRLFMIADAGGEYELAPITADRFKFLIVDADCIWEEGKLRVLYGGNEQASCERIDDAQKPELAPVTDYAATYSSDELEMRYTIEQTAGGGLTLQRPRFAASPLLPVARDEFTSTADGLQLRFVRNGGGAVDRMIVNAERVWNVEFTRAADRA